MPLKLTSLFFDKEHIIALIGEANARQLDKTTAHLKVVAQRSMRYSASRTYSAPGEPPRAHRATGAKVRKFLFNYYDPSTKSAVVGPEKLSNVRGKDVPRTLEKGGSSEVQTREVIRKTRGLFVGVLVQSHTARIAARPYMGPALQQELPLIPDRWLNSIQGP